MLSHQNLKKFLYWLTGERAGLTIVAIWHWLWGIPVDWNDQIAFEVAQESLQSMQRSVEQLTESTAIVIAAYRQAKQQYEDKKKECQNAEKQGLLAHKQGNQEAARLAMTRAITIERLLPQLAEQVFQAKQTMIAVKEKLDREHQKLEAYQID